ncbi:LysR family transcriptional regulator [Bombilactobacillus folatiphilus]|uniref:LysR family transcriptional regulator n=1 Tax=Bombilactobacillus folatiphilus TaxID=2923362 RepID=A0ABY4P8Z7_9LACO|nr:LysR family transcriptional regulator [Bombilactobacillus folatiphilus]UQS81991.1 LysR family transcriptional regulator [Bombilactobacillus folatiphilus]
MNFNDLEIYQMIFETKSINQAANKLQYTQSNLSARLQQLEQELDTNLFIRTNNGVSPTANGQLLYQFAKQTLDQFQQLKSAMITTKPRLLISELLLNYLIMTQKEFDVNHYEITIKETCEFQQALAQTIYQHVATFNPIKFKGYDLMSEASIETCWIAGANTQLAASLPIAVNHDTQCPLRKLTLDLLSETTNVIEIDSLENILQLVKQEKVSAMLPTYLLTDSKLVACDSRRWQIKYYHYQYHY